MVLFGYYSVKLCWQCQTSTRRKAWGRHEKLLFLALSQKVNLVFKQACNRAGLWFVCHWQKQQMPRWCRTSRKSEIFRIFKPNSHGQSSALHLIPSDPPSTFLAIFDGMGSWVVQTRLGWFLSSFGVWHSCSKFWWCWRQSWCCWMGKENEANPCT